MSAQSDRKYRSSVPNVRRAAAIHEAKQAKLDSKVDRLKQGSTGTALAKFVKRSIR
jgi:hypothetical protein